MVDIPVSAFTRPVILADTTPYTLYGLDGRDLSAFGSAPFAATKNQLDVMANTLMPTKYQLARGAYVDDYDFPTLTAGDAPKPFPEINPLTPKPTQVTFPNPNPVP